MTRQPDFSRAAAQASRCLLRLHVTTLPVRPLDMLRKCRNTVVYTYEEAAEHVGLTQWDFDRRCGDADAFTIRGQNAQGAWCFVVCYRAGGNPARLNFTLAHELGHIVLGHTRDDQADEAEANCFAQHLLCPAPVLRQMEKHSLPLTPQQVARACYVSPAAGAQAIKNLSRAEKNLLFTQVETLFSAAFST